MSDSAFAVSALDTDAEIAAAASLVTPFSYIEARKRHGESELLDEIVSAKPELDRTHSHSPEELREHGLQQLRAAVELLKSKAPGEVDAYRRFALELAGNVADAHRERGNEQRASDAERAAIAEIAEALGSAAP